MALAQGQLTGAPATRYVRTKLAFLETMKRLFIALTLLVSCALGQSVKWPEEKANDWYARQPWLVGSNYIPATAVNQLEMWQSETFDSDRMNLEFMLAENLGMNTMRV